MKPKNSLKNFLAFLKENLNELFLSPSQKWRFLLILCFGVFLRSNLAHHHPFWFDEAAMFFEAYDKNIAEIFYKRIDATHPPLTAFFLHFWQKISINPFFLRLPSLLLSIGFLFLVPVLIKTVFPKKRSLPLITLALFCFSHSLISLGFQLRPYPWELFLMITSLILFFYLRIQKKLYRIWIFAFGFLNATAFLTDYSSIWMLTSYGFFWLFLLITKKEKLFRRFIFKSLILTALLVSWWLPIMTKHLPESFQAEEYIKSGNKNRIDENIIIQNLAPLSGTGETGNLLTTLKVLTNKQWWWLLVLLSFLGNYYLAKKNKGAGIFFFTAETFPTIASFFFSKYISPIFLWRNLIFVHLAFLMNLAFFINVFWEKISFPFKTLLIFLFGLNFFLTYPTTYIGFKTDWRKVRTLLSYYPLNNSVFIIPNEDWPVSPLHYYFTLIPSANFDWEKQVISSQKISQKSNGYLVSKKKFFILPSLFKVNESQYPNLSERDIKEIERVKNILNCHTNIILLDFVYFAECK